MAKGDKFLQLTNYLEGCEKDEISMTFDQVEKVLGFKLSKSAYIHEAYWSNTKSHSSAFGWLNAGYKSSEVNIEKRKVLFKKDKNKLGDKIMEIVKFKLEEKDELLKLDKECFLEDYWEMKVWDSIFSELERNIIYLAKENEKIVSYLMIYNWGRERNYVKITNIGTKESFRGRGLAHKLFEVMIDEMKGLGMNEFIGETRMTNYPMQKVFNDFKFKPLEIVEGYYDNPTEDAIRYGLK